MANHKKKNPRVLFAQCRVTRQEKQKLSEDGMELGLDFSVYMRRLLGLTEENE